MGEKTFSKKPCCQATFKDLGGFYPEIRVLTFLKLFFPKHNENYVGGTGAPKICITSFPVSGILMRELTGWAQVSLNVGFDRPWGSANSGLANVADSNPCLPNFCMKASRF